MAEIIKDGRTGDTAKIDANNRLHTQSRTLDLQYAEALDGNAYDVSIGGAINLTDDALSSLVYIKNTGDEDLIVDTIFIDNTTSTGGSGTGYLNWVLNPTAGTLLSSNIPCTILNRRVGSPVNISAVSYKAETVGLTLTNSAGVISFPAGTGISVPFGKPFVIPKGQAFGVNYQPPVGNTSLYIQVGMLIVVDTTTRQ